MATREAFVGFDSAWAGRAPGGIAWATFANGHPETCGEPQLAGFDDAAHLIETLRTEHDYVLIAIDQPTVVPNATGQRPVDGVARALIGKLGSGVQPANRSKASMFGPSAPIWRFIDRLGARQDPASARAATEGLYLLEVFPALALPALQPKILTRRKAAFYNPVRKKTFTLSDWRLVADTVRHNASKRGLVPLSEWSGGQMDLTAPSKQDQDRLDSAICLLVALEWRQAPRDSVAVFGDAHTGYMVTPVSPETREVLRSAADEQRVPFDTHWPDTEFSARTRLRASGIQQPRSADDPNMRRTTRSHSPSRRRIFFDEAVLRNHLVQAARAHKTLTYGEVARTFGYRWSQGALTALTGTLRRIGVENRRRGEPQLMALVVNKAGRIPGPGYFQTLGIGRSSQSELPTLHARELTKIWSFDWPD